MRLLDRLIVTGFLKIFVAFTLGAPLLFFVGDITEKIDRYIDRNLPMTDVFTAYAYQLPQYILWSFPIATLVGAVFTIHQMTAHQEIVAAKAGGISFHRLIAPILVMGVFLAGAALYLSDLVPRTNRIAFEILEERDIGREWRADFVYQAEDGRTLSVRRLTVQGGQLQGVVMETEAAPGVGPEVHVVAERARFEDEEGWTFEGGYLRRIVPDAPERAYRFDRLQTRGFNERPDELLERPRDDDEMTYAEIDRLAGIIERSGGDSSKLVVKREQRVALAIATFVIMLFGLPLATSPKRGGTAHGVGVALGSVIFYIALLKVFGAVGGSGVMSPLAAAWIPNAVFFAVGVFLLARVRT